MRRQVKRACAATVATAAAVALAAGMTSPASAKPEQSTTAPQTQLTSKHRITLITGDRVVVDSKGRVGSDRKLATPASVLSGSA